MPAFSFLPEVFIKQRFNRVFLVLFVFLIGNGQLLAAPKIAVLDFELNDLTLAPNQPTEVQRTASLKGLLEQALSGKFELVDIPVARQKEANKGHGYLFEHPELVAELGKEFGADYVVSGRLHKPSFLFAYLMNKLVVVESGAVKKEFVTETKGSAAKLTARAVDSLAEKLIGVLAATPQGSIEHSPGSDSVTADKSSAQDSSLNFPVHTVTSKKLFDDVIEDLLLAIGGKNFRLTEHAKIGEAIADREAIEFPRVTVLHFCNLAYARRLLEMAPEMALRMPCRISIQQGENGEIIIKVLLLPAEHDDAELEEFAETINGILLDIVKEGAG